MDQIAGSGVRGTGVPTNITVEALHEATYLESSGTAESPLAEYAAAVNAGDANNAIINQIDTSLKELNAHKFIPMVTRARDACVAIALYAGDGIVAKITKDTELNGLRPKDGGFTPLPGVLPPIYTEKSGQYVVEIFPWIDTKNIDQKCVDEMQAYLAQFNLKMKEKDAKPNNIGRLPDHTLAVLDGNAVERIDKNKPVDTTGIHQWQDKVFSQFGALYTRDPETLISDNPDFKQSFSKYTHIKNPKLQNLTQSETTTEIPPEQMPRGLRQRLTQWWKGAEKDHGREPE